jgi:hypothetical protein
MNKKRIYDLKNEMIDKLRKNKGIECEEVFILVLYLFERMKDMDNELERIRESKKKSENNYKDLLNYF